MENWHTRLAKAIKLREITNAALAKATGNKPSSISDWLSGKTKMIGGENAVKACNYLKINQEWLFFGKGESGLKDYIDFEIDNSVGELKVSNELFSIQIPLLNVTVSMGNGENELPQEVVIDVLRICKSWIDKSLGPISNISNLSFIHAIGDSMQPTFNDGDILLVDSGNKNITGDTIFVLKAHERLFIKRVRQRIDGSYEISSDNPAVKTVDVLNGNSQVEIKGRVVWVWNGRKL